MKKSASSASFASVQTSLSQLRRGYYFLDTSSRAAQTLEMSSSTAPTTAVATEHRLHISGLTPQITPADLKERFQRFGNVETVDTVRPDALGTYFFTSMGSTADRTPRKPRSATQFRLFDHQCKAARFDQMYVRSMFMFLG